MSSLRSDKELRDLLRAEGLMSFFNGGHVALYCPEVKDEIYALWGGGELNTYDAAVIVLNGWITAVRERIALRKSQGKTSFFTGEGSDVIVNGRPYSLRSYWHSFANPNPNDEDIRASNTLFDYIADAITKKRQDFLDEKEEARRRRAKAKKRRENGEAGRGWRNVDKYGRDEVVEEYHRQTGVTVEASVREFVRWLYDDYRNWE